MDRELIKLIEENGLTLHGDIEHFAHLVAEREREACDHLIKGLREANEAFAKRQEWWTERMFLMEGFVKAAVAEEREACARVCEQVTAAWSEVEYNEGCMDCAKAIRARGDA